jgi:hypothetical protein
MRSLVVLVALACVACTQVATDPNAVVAVRFDGSAYPSIVAEDSLRDSLGALQPLKATGLNYKNDPVPGTVFVFSSPDTILKMFGDGVVYARGRKADAAPARVFATLGTLPSQPDSLFVVPRADSIKAAKDVDTLALGPTGTASTGVEEPKPIQFNLFGDTLRGAPKAPVPAWLVSFQLHYHGTPLPPTDTSKAYTFVIVGGGATTRLVPTFVDSTDASGKAERGVFVKSIPAGVAEDTILLVATARARKVGVPPFSDTTMILLRR